MLHLTRNSGLFLPLILAMVVLRAFVPVGYMPAAPGSGLLFELCHESALFSIRVASEEESSHAHHHASEQQDGDSHDAIDTCSLGHILSGASVDFPDMPQVAAIPHSNYDATRSFLHFLPTAIIGHPPRGPPLV